MQLEINDKRIGTGSSTYIVAEMSANHHQSFEQAVKIIQAAKEAGADAVKLQTYTPDTLTIDCRAEYFQVKGTLWNGKTLYDLYAEAYTPWEWQPKLKKIADGLGLDLFSTPFDATSVEFLEEMGVPAYKIASFELVDLALIRKVAKTGKPVILSTGMASLQEIQEAVKTAKQAGATQIALLKCTSAYPAPPEEMNLLTIPHLSKVFGLPCGLSDHTLGIAAPVAAVALGACIIEKHITLSRDISGPDSAFSLEAPEFKEMVETVRAAEKALGKINFELTGKEKESMVFRRSLFIVKDMKEGDLFTEDNVRAIRPGYGLAPRFLEDVLGRRALRGIQRGTPLTWELVR
jgi:N-acetylneuraminate synthase